MRICCASDLHGDYNKLIIPDGDILIIAGDLNAYGTSNELKDFCKWLDKQSHKDKIVTAGNHDAFIYDYNAKARKLLGSHCIYLENSGREINGIKFWGSPVTPIFGTWFFMADRGDSINRYWKLMPLDADVIITHGPPYEILDNVPLSSRYNLGDKHLGCYDLLQKIKKVKPKYHIFGHIHSGYGVTKIDDTTYINCSVMNEEYEVVNEPIVIEYDK